MELISIIGIAVGLAMDAFSVCIASGMVIEKVTFRHYFRLSFHFGLFQFFMPIIGYFAGIYIEKWVSSYDHWIAMALLSIVGLKMIKESFSAEENEIIKDPSRGWSLVILAVATSIDALAVGLSIGLLGKPILFPSAIIGITCAFFSIFGIAIGKRAGAFLGKKVEFIGGLILVAIGIKIVFEHIS